MQENFINKRLISFQDLDLELKQFILLSSQNFAHPSNRHYQLKEITKCMQACINAHAYGHQMELSQSSCN
jgi:hypothetical protein